jgi:hypothetical protein
MALNCGSGPGLIVNPPLELGKIMGPEYVYFRFEQAFDVLERDNPLKQGCCLYERTPVVMPGTCLFEHIVDPFDGIGLVVGDLTLHREYNGLA